MDKPRLGFIGLGLMGTPIALKLIEAGYPMTVYGRTQARLASALEMGAARADTPAGVAETAEIVFTCVTDTEAVEDVVFGPHGVARAEDAAGKVLIDHSSIRPAASRAMAARLEAEAGMGWIDAPVSGGAPGVAAKTLAVMCGGKPEVYAKVEPVIMSYAGRSTLMGPPGAGQTTKLINQALCGVGFALIAEVTALAERAGIDAGRIPEAIEGGRADSRLLQEFMPRMAARDFTPTGRIDIMLKDLDTVAELAREAESPVPLAMLAAEIHRLLVARGLGGRDNTETLAFFDPALSSRP